VGRGEEVPYLQLSQEADAHHLDSGKNENSCDDEERAVNRHNVLAGDKFQNEEPCRHAESSHHAEGTDCSKEVQRAGHVAKQEADCQQIEEHSEGARDAVMTLTVFACRIGDGNLADAGSIPGGEGRDEAVHLAVEGNVLDDFTAVRLKGRAEVVDIDATECRHEQISGARWDAAQEKVVSTLCAPAADYVVALFQLCQEVGNLLGVVLEVTVHRQDEVSLSVIEACGKGGGLTEVAPELYDEDTTVYCSNLLEEPVGSIAGAVVDKYQLEGVTDLLHYSLEAVIEGGYVLFFVMEGYDDRIFRHFAMILPRRYKLDDSNSVKIAIQRGILCPLSRQGQVRSCDILSSPFDQPSGVGGCTIPCLAPTAESPGNVAKS